MSWKNVIKSKQAKKYLSEVSECLEAAIAERKIGTSDIPTALAWVHRHASRPAYHWFETNQNFYTEIRQFGLGIGSDEKPDPVVDPPVDDDSTDAPDPVVDDGARPDDHDPTS